MAEYQVTEYRDEKCIVRVHRPILTDEEREAREEEIRKALVRFEKERMKFNGYKN
jgi:hypothetical protein